MLYSIRLETLFRLEGKKYNLFRFSVIREIVKAWPTDPLNCQIYSKRCHKNYHRDNWLVAAKRSKRRCFLILRCRLFLSLNCSWFKVSDCSPVNRERELGLDRRETG